MVADSVTSARLIAEIQTSPSVVGAVKRPVLSMVPLEAAQLTAESVEPVTVAVNWIWPLASTADAVDEIVTDTVGRVGPPASGWSPGPEPLQPMTASSEARSAQVFNLIRRPRR